MTRRRRALPWVLWFAAFGLFLACGMGGPAWALLVVSVALILTVAMALAWR